MRKNTRHENFSVYTSILKFDITSKTEKVRKKMMIYIICRIKEDILGHTCSMYGIVKKSIGLENLIRKYDAIYNRRLRDNIKNKRIMMDSYGSELGSVLPCFTCGLFFLLSEDNSDTDVVVTDLGHHRPLLSPANTYPRNPAGFCSVISSVSETKNNFPYARKNKRFRPCLWIWSTYGYQNADRYGHLTAIKMLIDMVTLRLSKC